VPVVAIVGQTNRSAMGGSYQQEVDLLSLFKDVASEYVQMVMVPEQLPNVLDRAIRTALAERAPTVLIIPADVQELAYSAPTHAFKMVPSSLGVDWPTSSPDDDAIQRAAEVLNSGSKVAILAGQGARGARRELEEIAGLLGAGVAKPLLGKDVLSDELPYVTGAIGLLGTRPSYEMMMHCDTLLTVGSSFPYTQFLPGLGSGPGRRPARGARPADRPQHPADPAARHLRAGQGRRHGPAEGRRGSVDRAQGGPPDQGQGDPAGQGRLSRAVSGGREGPQTAPCLPSRRRRRLAGPIRR